MRRNVTELQCALARRVGGSVFLVKCTHSKAHSTRDHSHGGEGGGREWDAHDTHDLTMGLETYNVKDSTIRQNDNSFRQKSSSLQNLEGLHVQWWYVGLYKRSQRSVRSLLRTRWQLRADMTDTWIIYSPKFYKPTLVPRVRSISLFQDYLELHKSLLHVEEQTQFAVQIVNFTIFHQSIN